MLSVNESIVTDKVTMSRERINDSVRIYDVITSVSCCFDQLLQLQQEEQQE